MLLCVGLQEKTTNRYQMDVNGVTITIVRTDNTTTRWSLLNNLNAAQVYDVVSGWVGVAWRGAARRGAGGAGGAPPPPSSH